MYRCRSAELNSLITPTGLPITKTAIEMECSRSSDDFYSLKDSALVHHSIEDTGMYIILFGVCGPFTSPVQIQGTIESMDPCKLYRCNNSTLAYGLFT